MHQTLDTNNNNMKNTPDTIRYERFGTIYESVHREMFSKIHCMIQSRHESTRRQGFQVFQFFCCGRPGCFKRTPEVSGECGDSIFSSTLPPIQSGCFYSTGRWHAIMTSVSLTGRALTLYYRREGDADYERRRKVLADRFRHYTPGWSGRVSYTTNTSGPVPFSSPLTIFPSTPAESYPANNPDCINRPEREHIATEITSLKVTVHHLRRQVENYEKARAGMRESTNNYRVRADQAEAALRTTRSRLADTVNSYEGRGKVIESLQSEVVQLRRDNAHRRAACCDTAEENDLRSQVESLCSQLKSAENTIAECRSYAGGSASRIDELRAQVCELEARRDADGERIRNLLCSLAVERRLSPRDTLRKHVIILRAACHDVITHADENYSDYGRGVIHSKLDPALAKTEPEYVVT